MLGRLLGFKSKSSQQASKFILEKTAVLDGKARHCYQQGYYREAATYYRKSLVLRGNLGENHPDFLENNYRLAIALKEFGDFEEACKRFTDRLEILQNSLGSIHPEFQKARIDLGGIPLAENYNQTERLFLSCLSNLEKTLKPDHPYIAECLLKLGKHLLDIGKHNDAEPILLRCLSIKEKLGHVPQGEPKLFVEIARFYHMKGDYSESLTFFQQGLTLLEDQLDSNHPEVAKALGIRAGLSESLGGFPEAEQFYRRSLRILEERLNPDHPEIAKILEKFANLLCQAGHTTEAKTYYNRCHVILIRQYRDDHPIIARLMTNQTQMLLQIGDYRGAEELCRRSLTIKKKRFAPDSLDVAYALRQLAVALNKLAKYDEAGSHCRRSLSICQQHLDPDHPQVAQGLMALAFQFDERGNSLGAIFLAKKAINVFQGVRRSVSTIGEEQLVTFDISIETHYNFLANILIKSGRYGEAEHVMGMLKDKELLELFRGDVDESLPVKTIQYNSMEDTLVKQLDHICSKIYEQGKETSNLINVKNRNLEQNEKLVNFEGMLFKSKQTLMDFIDALKDKLQSSTSPNAEHDFSNPGTLPILVKNVETIFTVTSEYDFHTVMLTTEGHIPFTTKFKCHDLSKLIIDFRVQLKDIESDEYLPLAKELYDIIIRPMEKNLSFKANKSITWYLNGALRLLPFAALHDGKQFFLEKFSNISITNISNVEQFDHAPWNALGMGTTQGYAAHQPLHAVKEELEGIIRTDVSDGILPGRILLDDLFTKESMQKNISDGYKAVHFASHFVLNPANEANCYLLLGDGRKMRMSEFRELPQLFRGVDLVAFSACSTGLGTTNMMGREVDGLGYLGELQGAMSVLATLWPVEDKSTSMTMRKFYRLREDGDTKAEALRRAQLALLKGEITSDEGHDFTHPYFWAPFVLIGNGG